MSMASVELANINMNGVHPNPVVVDALGQSLLKKVYPGASINLR